MLYAIAGSEQHILESGNAFVIDNKAWIERGFAVFCIVFVALVHSLLPKVGLAIQNGLSVLKLLLLSLLLIIGVTAATGLTSLPRANNFEDLFAGTSTDAHAYSSALLAAFFTSDGWNALNYSLDELVDPVRNLPRASLTSVITVSLLYIAAILSYFMVIPIVDIDTNSAILAGQFFTLTMGEIVGKRIVPVLISLSAFSGVMSGVFGASRLIYAAAREGFFPFKKLFGASTKEGAPIGGLMLHMVMALLLTLAPPPGRIYQFLIDVSAYPSWFFYAMTVTGLLYLRYTEPDTKRPFKSPYLTNVFFVAVCVFVVVVPFVPPEELPTTGIPYYLHALIGITIMLFCIPGWYLQVGRKHYRNQPKGDESDPFAFGSDKEDNKRTHQRDWSTGGDVHSYSPTLVSEEDTS